MGLLESLLAYGPRQPGQMSYVPGYEPIMPQIATPVPNGASVAAPTETNWWDSMVGTEKAPGWGGLALGGASALMNGYLGLQQLGIAKDTLAENKRQFQLNFDAQKKTTNSALEDRQRARVASNPGAYQSVGDYMKQNGI